MTIAGEFLQTESMHSLSWNFGTRWRRITAFATGRIHRSHHIDIFPAATNQLVLITWPRDFLGDFDERTLVCAPVNVVSSQRHPCAGCWRVPCERHAVRRSLRMTAPDHG